MWTNIFYGYGIFYLASTLFNFIKQITKKHSDENLVQMGTGIVDINEVIHNPMGFFKRYFTIGVMLVFVDVAWLIIGFWTPEAALFIAFSVLTVIVLFKSLRTMNDIKESRKLLVTERITKIILLSLILFCHYYQ